MVACVGCSLSSKSSTWALERLHKLTPMLRLDMHLSTHLPALMQVSIPHLNAEVSLADKCAQLLQCQRTVTDPRAAAQAGSLAAAGHAPVHPPASPHARVHG